MSSPNGVRGSLRQRVAHVLGFSVIDKRYDAIPQPNQPETITLSTKLTGQKWQSYAQVKQDLDRRRELWNLRIKNGPAATILDAYENATFTNGWKIESSAPWLSERLTKRLQVMHAENDIRKAFTDGLSFGAGICEKARLNSQDGFSPPRTVLVARCSRDFDLVTNSWGTLVSVRQYDPMGRQVAELPADRALVIMPLLTSEGFGKSLLEQCYDPLIWWDMISRASADAIWRHGNPIWNIEVSGPDGKVAPLDVMTGMEGITTDLNSKAEIVTSALTQIKELNTNGVPQANAYLEWALMNICASSSVPEELFGLGKGNTGLLAANKWAIFYDKINAVQHAIEPQIDAQLMDPLCLEEGAAVGDAHWVFNNPNPTNDLQKVQFLKELVSLNPFNPLVDNNWMLDYLGIKLPQVAQQQPEVQPNGQSG